MGQRLSNIRTQQKEFQSGQSYSYMMRKVWYHQIRIQNYFNFIVSDLLYMTLHNLVSGIEDPICLFLTKFIF